MMIWFGKFLLWAERTVHHRTSGTIQSINAIILHDGLLVIRPPGLVSVHPVQTLTFLREYYLPRLNSNNSIISQ